MMAQEFSISDSAAQRIAYLLNDEPDGSKLRISVEGGGCSGFQYHFDFDHAATNEDDRLYHKNDATVIVDTMSLEFLTGGMIDYVQKLGASYFEITNPNSSASCGCGNSFAV